VRIELVEVASSADLVVLRARRKLDPAERVLRYETRTGALLRLDGAVAGAFDREHRRIVLTPHGGAELVLEVERRSLPSSGLPASGGLRWNLMLRAAEQPPSRSIDVEAIDGDGDAPRIAPSGLAVVGHAHLDVAWLWTYAEARRKALRTFATAVRLLDLHDRFVFTQSQPQLYEWVAEEEPGLFARVRDLCGAGRFDASGAAMWVEPDCNLPSGESLLRQLAFGIRYAVEQLGTTPTVAWLPDSFGFPNTLPTLLAHAGIGAFATTKLCWNDTSTFPHRQFVWEGPDGSGVVAAILASYEGAMEPSRVALASERDEPLVVGYGDGGGGPTDEIVTQASEHGAWTTLDAWFADVRRRETLPVHRDELYLEYHRGVSTTHHDVKARNAALERALGEAEAALSWAVVLRASPYFTDEMRAVLHEAWKIVLRAQFHDVLPGTSIAAVYADVLREYDRADALVRRVLDGVRTMLPRLAPRAEEPDVTPRLDGDRIRLANDRIAATLRADGTIEELRLCGGPNLVERANTLVAYADRPQKWEAWNIDRGYERKTLQLRPTGFDVADDALHVRYAVGGSVAAARISLAPAEPFLRVEFAVDWRERRTLLRCENDLALGDARAFFGAPHGAVERSAYPTTPAERAKFEACGQRFARVDGVARDGRPGGVALLVRDTYGWSVAGEASRVRLGHSLLRGTTWPDPGADLGEHRIGYAFVPLAEAASMGMVEAVWQRYAIDPAVPLFTCADEAIAVVATKPAGDGDGVVVRARECDGRSRDVSIACAARANDVVCVDALERTVSASVAALRGGAIVTRFAPYELRSFRVRFA
jgi:alpha-mannosidase